MRHSAKGCVLFWGDTTGNVLFTTSALREGRRPLPVVCPRVGKARMPEQTTQGDRLSHGLLNVADLTVDEGDLQVLVDIDPFGTEIYDLLRLALDGAHLVDGEAEGESGRGAGVAALE